MTDTQLRWWYGRLNKLYFRGKLPKPEELRFRRLRGFKGRNRCSGLKMPPFRIRWVYISTSIRMDLAYSLVVLLHEMAHIHLNLRGVRHNCLRGNNPFGREIKRLVRAGAYDRVL